MRNDKPLGSCEVPLVVRETINLTPCGSVTVFGVLQTGQIRLSFVSGFSAEGSVTLETLKVFMQFVHA
jgi:hypothetical protein